MTFAATYDGSIYVGVSKDESVEWWSRFAGFTAPPATAVFAEQEFDALNDALQQAFIMWDEEPLTEEPVGWMAEALINLVTQARNYGAEAYAVAIARSRKRPVEPQVGE